MVKTADPLVSMIVLCYNHARFVLETLESVKAQTYKTTQLIIVDDCSSDESVATIETWLQKNRIDCTFIRHKKNQGVCKSLNDALAVAKGKYISIIASDDVWLPDKILQQVEVMEVQPTQVGVLYSDAFQMDEQGKPLSNMFIETHRKLAKMPQGQILDTLLQGNFIPAMTALIRRSCYEEVGSYDENLLFEDWDMWLRIARNYSFIYSPKPLARYRYAEKSLCHGDRNRSLKESFKTCLKQFKLGHITEDQKSRLTVMMLESSEELYKLGDLQSTNILLSLWQATGIRKVGWMYQFARVGISFRNWQRTNKWLDRFHRKSRIHLAAWKSGLC